MSVLYYKEGWLSLLDEVEEISHVDVVYTKVYAAQVAHLGNNGVETISLYSMVRDSDGEGLEVLVNQDSNLSCRIRHIETGALKILQEAKAILHKR